MKESTFSLSACAVIAAMISVSAVLASSHYDGTKEFVLTAGASGYTEVEWTYFKKIRVRATADHGRVHIKVLNSRGRTITSGFGNVSFNTGKQRTSFRLVFTNKSKKVQRVKTSWTEGDMNGDG